MIKKYFVMPGSNGKIYENVNGGAIPIENIPVEQERWTKFPEFDRYSISTKGRVRNDKTGRILKPGLVGTHRTTYLRYRLCREGQRHDFFAHDLLERLYGDR